MSIKAHLNPGLAGGNRSDSLDLHAARLYEAPRPVMAVVELLPVDRVVPIDGGSEKDPVVRLRIESLEVAPGGGAESTLRDVQRALYVTRTANGTLGSEDELQSAAMTLEHAGDLVAEYESARLRVVLDVLLDRVAGVLSHPKHREADVRRLIGELLEQAEKARDTGVQLEMNGASR
jgi:hypothetical protein